MASNVITIPLEFEALSDACAELSAVHQALTRRHGDHYRALERRIEALAVSQDLLPVLVPMIGKDGGISILPPRELTELLRDARALGVIG